MCTAHFPCSTAGINTRFAAPGSGSSTSGNPVGTGGVLLPVDDERQRGECHAGDGGDLGRFQGSTALCRRTVHLCPVDVAASARATRLYATDPAARRVMNAEFAVPLNAFQYGG